MNETDREHTLAAIEHIKATVGKLIPGATTKHQQDQGRGVYRFSLHIAKSDRPVAEFRFSDENLEDFIVDNTDYGIRYKYFINFKLYTELTKARILPTSFRISRQFIEEGKERRDWWTERYTRVAFDKEMTAAIISGLKELSRQLSATVESDKVGQKYIRDLKEDHERIAAIISYHDTHGSLDETSASVKSLSIIKSAGIMALVQKEKARNESPPYLAGKISEEIVWLVGVLRGQEFLEVQPAEWLEDYVAS